MRFAGMFICLLNAIGTLYINIFSDIIKIMYILYTYVIHSQILSIFKDYYNVYYNSINYFKYL